MKTAVSVPDDVYQLAERLAKRERRSRSDVYTAALREYVLKRSPERWVDAPGNVRLTARTTGLDRDSVANVTQIVTLDKAVLDEQVGRIPAGRLELVLAGIDTASGDQG